MSEMSESAWSRRQFVRRSVAATGAAFLLPGFRFYINTSRPVLGNEIVGHGDYRYRVEIGWGDLDPAATPVNNCHEMVMDSRGRLIMITDETRNNILVYDRSGKLLDSWGNEYPGGHGLTLWNAGGEEFLFICDPQLGKVVKTTLDGRVLLTIEHPRTIGEYGQDAPFRPTETAIGPNGEIYIADGYGSQFILQYAPDGEFIRKFGGQGDRDDQFQTAHGVALDTRDRNGPTLLCTSRAHNAFKRFTLDGKYLSTVFLPGAYVCRAVVHEENVYSGVCWSRLKYLNQTPNSGFISILDGHDRVISNPGGTAPEYRAGELQLMVQASPVFRHCHDVCVDSDSNLYVCQWNANRTYPIKLHRVA
jgi:hypothetical protein